MPLSSSTAGSWRPNWAWCRAIAPQVAAPIMLGISKRGDRYLRSLLIHGARAALWTIERRPDQRSAWAGRLKLRRGPNVAAVALAHKNARVLWALLRNGEAYRVAPLSLQAAG